MAAPSWGTSLSMLSHHVNVLLGFKLVSKSHPTLMGVKILTLQSTCSRAGKIRKCRIQYNYDKTDSVEKKKHIKTEHINRRFSVTRQATFYKHYEIGLVYNGCPE